MRADHNVQLGALYMRELLDKLSGSVPLAVGAYNSGLDAITRWQTHAQGESLDVFVETIPFLETRGYVVRVMGNLARYGFMERGEAGVPVSRSTLTQSAQQVDASQSSTWCRPPLLLEWPAHRARALFRSRFHRPERLLRRGRVRARQDQHDAREHAEGAARGPAYRARAQGGLAARPLPLGHAVRDHAGEPRARLDRRARRPGAGRSRRPLRHRPRAGRVSPLCRRRHRVRGADLRARPLRRARTEARRHPALREGRARLGATPPDHLHRLPAAALHPREGDEAHSPRHGHERRRGERRLALGRRADRHPRGKRRAEPRRQEPRRSLRARRRASPIAPRVMRWSRVSTCSCCP